MGVVYAARHVIIDKPVAIKVLRQEYCRDPGLVERFMREARAASRIGHPNIVDVTDFGRTPEGQIYFVMEFLVGVTLSREIRSMGCLPVERALDLAIQICHGLQAAHDKGIVHRDLKPENVFIVNPSNEPVIEDAGGRRADFVKLLDFGIAKISWGPGTRLTKAGSIFGTPQYMSPEQAAGQDADHRGDLYSLGCILYEMVTGEVPFLADTFMGTLTKHMFERPQPPRQLRPDLAISEALEGLILRAMAKDPTERFDSASDLAAAIAGLSVPIPTPAPTFPPGETQLRTPPTQDPDERALQLAHGAEPEEDPLPPAQRRALPTDAVRYRRPPSALPWVAGLLGLLVVGGFALLMARRSDRTPGDQGADATARGTAQTGPALSANRSDATRPAAALDAMVATAADTAPIATAADAAPMVTLQLLTVPPGALIRADGKPIGRSPTQLTMAPGSVVELRFNKPGYHPRRRRVTVPDAGRNVPLRVVLRRRGRAAPRDPRLSDLREPDQPEWKKKGRSR